jgi:N-acetylglucosaminyl-diphospho-decaprenol L-rhamnosyltransferase
MGFITISVVSHGHAVQVAQLLAQLSALRTNTIAKVIVTVNSPGLDKALQGTASSYPHLSVQWVHNPTPLGFGANHNRAFALCESAYFCVLNPDIALHGGYPDPFMGLLAALSPPAVGLAYPVQVGADGAPLDFARALPTPRAIGHRHGLGSGTVDSSAHWASGAFLMFKSELFRALGGFDERYFMYCEDVDICLRTQLAGYRLAQAEATVVHHTQRRTLKSVQHLAWHVRSLWRLWQSQAYLQYKKQFVAGDN